MSPPGAHPSISPNLRANGARSTDFLSPRIVAREASKVLNDLDVEVRPATLRLLVTRFIREGHTTTNEFRTWFIAYSDPTGETAVRNVMRGSR